MPTLMGHLKFCAALLGMSLRASAARRGAFALQVGLMAANNLVFFVFWLLLFQQVPTIRGHALSDVAALFGVVAIAFGLVQTLAGGVRRLGQLIDTGELDALLAQPKPVLLYAAGMRSQASGIGDALSGAALIAGFGDIELGRVPMVLLAVAISAVVLGATTLALYSAAFWLGKSESAARQFLELLLTFSLYPESLFGGAVRLLLFSLLPAAFVGHLPARLVRQPTLSDALIGIGAALLALSGATWMFHRGLRRYSSGSRFGTLG